MRWQLVVERGNRHGQVIPLPTKPVWIGRGPDCQIRPAAPTVSRRHCALVQRQGRLFVTPGATTNGTFINGQRIEQEGELHPGDQLKIGPVAFRIMMQAGVRRGQVNEEAVATMLLEGENMDHSVTEKNATPATETAADHPAFAWRDTRPDQIALPPMDWFATESQTPSQSAKAAEQLLGVDPKRPISLFDFRRKK